MTNNKDLNYIVECAESVGIHVDEHTAISIPFIADVMLKMREQSNSDEDCISRAEAIKALEYDLSIEADGGLDKYRTVIKDLLNAIYNTQKKAIEDLPSIQPKTDVLDKIRAEIAEYGSIMVSYTITTNDTKTDKGIEKLVSDVLKQAKEQVLDIIDKYKAESEG